MNEKKFVTSKELAKILGVSSHVIDGWSYRDHVTHFKPEHSNKYLYDVDECKKYYEVSVAKQRKERVTYVPLPDSSSNSNLDVLKQYLQKCIVLVNDIQKEQNG